MKYATHTALTTYKASKVTTAHLHTNNTQYLYSHLHHPCTFHTRIANIQALKATITLTQ